MITLNAGSVVPPFDQIREQVAGLIRLGVLPAGHRLPSIRQLAADLRLAPGTVARAYAGLDAAGLIRISRTGAFVAVAQTAEPALLDSAQRLARKARTAGLTLDDAIAALRAIWTQPA